MSAPVLVIGGTGGIGAALARRLIAEGQSVHVFARDEARLAALAGELGCATTSVDVLDDDALKTAVEAVGAELAGLVYAVGSIPLMPLRRATSDAFVEAYRLNVVAAAQAVRHAQKALAAVQGSVVLFSSVAAGRGFANHAVIGAAKAGVEGLTRALAAELAPKIRVNCIAPSLTRTPLAAGLVANAQVAEAIAHQHPLQRLGEADDVAALAVHLLGKNAAYMTGQVIGVDGGRGAIAS